MWGYDTVRIRSCLLVSLEGLSGARLSPVDIDLCRPCTLSGTDQALEIVHSTAVLNVLGWGILCDLTHRFTSFETLAAPQ